MITILTVTGDRPVAFAQLEKYMARQTVGFQRWIVVDDGNVPTPVTMGQDYHRLEPGQPSNESFRSNMTHALNICRTGPNDRVIIVEDDDWYSRWHIEIMNHLLMVSSIAGQARAKYYNAKQRKFQVMPNSQHASTAQMGFCGRDVKQRMMTFLAASKDPKTFDGHIWRNADIPESRKRLLPTSITTISMKGLPGRGGLGNFGHDEVLKNFTDDFEAHTLRKWLAEDAAFYEQFYVPRGV